ncbi:DNA mismatch endonuclease Vsr [Rouxiella badensis]|jgi:DNA mismatch endonuclease (patch repair protein)|uniref:very short patch repair endonuclease n=1 Tax=Rouxiella badensis TaxID=1646377 RepID=UPI0013EF1262|nr:DNA mismatch endonuclease Vsr [Rouxiella badensis]QII39499.1 DNA mismatch endonuclease Vsr [Rouxiella badensis]
MADVHNPATRSKNMKAIRNHGTVIEKTLSEVLSDLGLDFLAQVKEMPGKPDFVLNSYRKIIFTHGCFWHHHNCYLFKIPATRTDFWLKKISQNTKRDMLVNQKLVNDGWNILIIWECAIKGRLKLSRYELSARIEEWVLASNSSAEIDTKGIHIKDID